MKNRIREFRKLKGLTQTQLGERVGTSQQNIQRIEAGFAAPRFDLATEICKVLENPFHAIFPETSKKETRHMRRTWLKVPLSSECPDIKLDYLFLMVRLRGGYEASIKISKSGKNQLWKMLQRSGSNQFCVFDAGTERILINLDHLIFSQLLFEDPNSTWPAKKDTTGYQVKFYTYDKETPFIFDVEADAKCLGDETAYWEDIQFQEILEMAVKMPRGNDSDDVFMFADSDGETAFFRVNDVAMIKIPLQVLATDM